MSTSLSAEHKTAWETIDLLQYRLQRLEFYLTGSDNGQEQLQKADNQGRGQGVLARLAKAENDLAQLASKSRLVHELLTLCTLILHIMHSYS